PSAVVLWLLNFVYVTWGKVPWIASIFYGLKPAVLAIVAAAVIRIGRRALKNEIMWGVALLAFVAIYFFEVPFPAIVFGAGLLGLVGGKFWPKKFLVSSAHEADSGTSILSDDADSPAHTKPSFRRGLKVCAVSIALWFTPIIAVALWLGTDHTLFREGIFFSKAAMVTFGGAYAVLPYVSQQAVEHYGWLTAPEMLDGLGLAETTPGPLIMVLQFVGFLGAWHHPQPLSPLFAATLGAFITTWTTFVPCFLWIFLGAPHIEQLRGNVRLTSALSTVTAAVVGVILNLAVWFAQHTVFPSSRQIDWFVLVVALVTFVGLWRWKWNVIAVVLGAGLLGLIYRSVSS
ncbi:MAG TPA: chromate transporter, partial [Candidatus Limnocylindria bacterium]|nr:chromate transporter [Candidatus Limnocylindria bacterium]